METEYDEPSKPFVSQGDRSNSYIEVRVSHDLGDRTLVVVILLAAIIGLCGVVIGNDVAERRMQTQYMLELSTKMQIAINHKVAIEEKEHAR